MTKTNPATLFLKLIDKELGDRPKAAVAAHMDVRPQTLYKWIAHARADKNFLLPPLRARQIAEFFGIAPAHLRPDVFGE